MMNQHKKLILLQNIFKKKKNNLSNGFTLVEVLVVCSIIGILSALTMAAKPWYENPLANSRNQIVGIFKTVRLRAMSTSSTYRIRPDPAKPTQKLKVELTKSGSCDAITTLKEEAIGTDQSLKVNKINGFSIGDKIQVGSDSTNNNIIAVNPDAPSIQIGTDLGSTQSVNASVIMLKDWINEAIFVADDLTLNNDVKMSATPGSQTAAWWSACFSSRGFVTFFNGSTKVNSNLELTLSHSRRNETKTIVVYQGGAIDAP